MLISVSSGIINSHGEKLGCFLGNAWPLCRWFLSGFSDVELNGKMFMELLHAARLGQKPQTMLFVVCWVVVPHRWLVVVGGVVRLVQ